MADRPPLSPRAAPPRPAARRGPASPPSPPAEHHPRSLVARGAEAFHARGRGSTQLLGFLALAVTLTALLVLAGVTLCGALAALVALSPLVLLTFPLWAPVAAVAFLAAAASLAACCAGAAAVAAGTWAHRYLAARRAVTADQQHARGGGAVAEVASRVRGYYDAYAREHGGYPPRPHPRVKDAAPGA